MLLGFVGIIAVAVTIPVILIIGFERELTVTIAGHDTNWSAASGDAATVIMLGTFPLSLVLASFHAAVGISLLVGGLVAVVMMHFRVQKKFKTRVAHTIRESDEG